MNTIQRNLTLALTCSSLLFLPSRPRADHPLAYVAAVVVGGAIVTAGVIAYNGGEGSVSATVKQTNADGSSTEGTIEVELDGSGGGGEDSGGPGASIAVPGDFPALVQHPGYTLSESMQARFLPDESAEVRFDELHYEADVLNPGFGPSNLAQWGADRRASMFFERPAGVPAGAAGSMSVPISITDLQFSTTQVPDTFGLVEFELVVKSPQLGVLFTSKVHVPQDGDATVSGDIPASAFDFEQGIAKLSSFQTTITAHVPAALQTIELVTEFNTRGRGVEEVGTLELERSGGALGESVDYLLKGDPGELYWLIPSLSDGPTPLSPIDASDPRSLGVGLGMLSFARVGIIPASGQVNNSYPLPAAPALSGLVLRAQAMTLSGSTVTTVDNLSEVSELVLAEPGDTHFALGEMLQTKRAHTATTLQNGRILLAGGLHNSGGSPSVLAEASTYDPLDMSFSATARPLSSARARHTAVTLADGRVLLIGGIDSTGTPTASTELYDPATDSFAAGASMTDARVMHTSTLLADGRVFVIGGTAFLSALNPKATFAAALGTSEIYDPATERWSAGPSIVARVGHGASMLGDGRVLISGGVIDPAGPAPADETAEVLVYDPALGSVSMDVPLETARAFHAQIATADGGALVQGGSQLDAQPSPSLEFDVTALDSATHYGVNGAGDTSEDWGDEVIINDGKGMCWFCHPNGWYCGFPCLPIPITGGELLSGLGSGGSGGSVVSLQSDWTTQSTIGWPLVPRSLPGMAWEQDQSHLIVTGGAATVEAEVLVVGDGSKF